jgi:hypothetical protein
LCHGHCSGSVTISFGSGRPVNNGSRSYLDIFVFKRKT